jgi:hypothetical protein
VFININYTFGEIYELVNYNWRNYNLLWPRLTFFFTIRKIWRAKKENLNALAMKTQLQSAIAWNLGAMACSGIGLMIVVLGVILKA